MANAIARFFGAPKLFAPVPPAAQFMATGSSDAPISVITVPVTTGGNSTSSRLKKGDSTTPSTPATITAPYTARRPSRPPPASSPTTIMVATGAKLMPCTSGSLAPTRQTPSVCSSVASPQTSSVEARTYVVSAVDSVSPPPSTSGTAMMPAYIDRTCCRP